MSSDTKIKKSNIYNGYSEINGVLLVIPNIQPTNILPVFKDNFNYFKAKVPPWKLLKKQSKDGLLDYQDANYNKNSKLVL